MNTTTTTPNQEATMTTLTAAKAIDVRWVSPEGLRGLVNNRLWGITNGEGMWLSFNGTSPSVWDRRTAVEIAETIDRSADLRFVRDVAR